MTINVYMVRMNHRIDIESSTHIHKYRSRNSNDKHKKLDNMLHIFLQFSTNN